jgi:hypothetical protein
MLETASLAEFRYRANQLIIALEHPVCDMPLVGIGGHLVGLAVAAKRLGIETPVEATKRASLQDDPRAHSMRASVRIRLPDGSGTWLQSVSDDAGSLLMERREMAVLSLKQWLAHFDHLSQEKAEGDPKGATASQESTPQQVGTPGSDSFSALLSVFTNGVSDERMLKASRILENDNMTANEKLSKIDALIPIPASASAEDLGNSLGVSKQAIMKTQYWKDHRKGAKDEVIERRRAVHRTRAEGFDPNEGQEDR